MFKFAVVLLVIPAGAAVAQTVRPEAPAPVKRMCRAETATGTIMSARVCRTKAEWASIDAEHTKAMNGRRTSNTIERSQGGAGTYTDSFGQ